MKNEGELDYWRIDLEVSSEYIELEITEAALMEHSDYSIRTMKKFKDCGFNFAIDDFGTGYSSLNYLSKFPIDTLKIDQSFIRNMEYSEQDRSIIKTIIDLSSNLNLHVIAEGVETQKQSQILSEMGCDVMQGYFYSKPLASTDMEKLLKEDMNPLYVLSN